MWRLTIHSSCYQAKVGGWKRSNGGSARGGWVGASLFIKAKFPHFYQHSLISPSPALLLFRHHVTCSMGIKNKRTASSVWYWGKFLGAIIPSTLVSQWPSDLLCEYFLNIELKACLIQIHDKIFGRKQKQEWNIDRGREKKWKNRLRMTEKRGKSNDWKKRRVKIERGEEQRLKVGES